MQREVNSAADAESVLEHFNAFHDGFLKRISIISDGEFEAIGIQNLADGLTLELLIAHYNYQNGTVPHDRLISAVFFGVTAVDISFTGRGHEWTINHLGLTPSQREAGARFGSACLEARIVQHHLSDARQWVLKNDMVFLFEKAVFREL